MIDRFKGIPLTIRERNVRDALNRAEDFGKEIDAANLRYPENVPIAGVHNANLNKLIAGDYIRLVRRFNDLYQAPEAILTKDGYKIFVSRSGKYSCPGCARQNHFIVPITSSNPEAVSLFYVCPCASAKEKKTITRATFDELTGDVNSYRERYNKRDPDDFAGGDNAQS
ncbi:MAG: hypothetical protein LCH63_10175 [Candidatus Melainabacteria bacterium]|nr:hypothetical protein [Candidatus Melainabacteria bacterium]